MSILSDPYEWSGFVHGRMRENAREYERRQADNEAAARLLACEAGVRNMLAASTIWGNYVFSADDLRELAQLMADWFAPRRRR